MAEEVHPTDGESSDYLDLQQLEKVCESANIPTLLMVIYQVTGDSRWLEAPYRPTRTRGLSDHDSGGLPPEVQAEVRRAAARAFRALQDGNPPVIAAPTPQQTAVMLGACVGEDVDESYGVMFSTEFRRRIGLDVSDGADRVAVPADFRVLVVGAGVSGIIAAQRLTELGVPYLLVDRHDAPGGNWLDNRYPGAGVDTPSHLYSYSFAPHDWGYHFELRSALEDYFNAAFDVFGGRENARFNTDVVSASYDETAAHWMVTLQSADGRSEDLPFQAVITAVGILNKAKLPNVPGWERFRGPSFHSSEWPAGLDVAGKRVAVIGSGASAMQIAPAIVDEVEELLVFQRTPPWVAPFEKFLQPIDEGTRYLLRTYPIYRTWYWLKLYWQFGDKVLDSLRKDPEWPYPDRSVNARNDGHREFFTQYIKDELGDRADLFEKVLPAYPPYGKRILLDNGWYRTLCRDNVTLVTNAVAAVTEAGVITDTGTEYEADILVWATGFEATRFVSSLEIIGRHGESLREAWDDDDARAYLGVTVPGFPNLFLVGGPNSFPGSGSFMYFMEVQMRYIARILVNMFEAKVDAIDVRREVFDEYNQLLDEMSAQTVWTHPGTNTYFRNARGRLLFVSPFRNVEYWLRAELSNLDDYEILASAGPT